MTGLAERVAGVFRRQKPFFTEADLAIRDDFEEMRRRVEVGIDKIPSGQWPIRSTEAFRLLADCLNKDPYQVAPDIPSVINHGIIRFEEGRQGQRVTYLLTPDMFRAFAAYHWTRLWTSNSLQGRVALARQMLGERNPLAALLNPDPVYRKRNNSDVGEERRLNRRVVPETPLFVSYQGPKTEEPRQPTSMVATESPAESLSAVTPSATVVFDTAAGEAGEVSPRLVQDLRNKLGEVEKALGELSRPQARSGIFRKGDILDRSVRIAFGGSYLSLQKFMAEVINTGIIKPIANKNGVVEFTRDHVLALVALFIMHNRVPEENLIEVTGRTIEVLSSVDLKLIIGVINNPLAYGDGLTKVEKDEESEELREEITLEGAEARADGVGETPKRKRGNELSEEKRREIIGKIPQTGDEELEKARAWNRQTIERYMKSLSNQTDVVYNKSKALAQIVMFIAQASRRSLEKFDPELENLMEFQVKRALGICLMFIGNHREIGDLAKLFEVTKRAVNQNPFHFWKNEVRES